MRLHGIDQTALCRRENRARGLDLLAGLAALLPQQRGDLLVFAGEIQRRLAFALRVHVRTLLEQQRRRVLLSAPHRHVQRRVALLVGSVHVRTALEVLLDGLQVTHLRSGKNILGSRQLLGCLASLAAQQFRQLGAFLRQRVIEWRLVFTVLGIHRRPGVEQRLGQVKVAVVIGNVMQRRLAALAGQTDIGLGLEQRLGHFDMPLLRGQVQRGVAALVLAVHFRATGQKFLDRLHVAHLCGSENILGSQKFLGCLAALGAKQFDNLSALLRDGVVERCLVFLVLGIDRCALLQQQRRRGLVAFLGSVVQGRLLRLVGGSDIGLGLQQRADSIDLPRLGCDVQCRLAGLVLAVHIDARLEVFLEHV